MPRRASVPNSPGPASWPDCAEPTEAGSRQDLLAFRAWLVATLEHDLRNSLTTVLGALQMMSRPDLAPSDPDAATLLAAGLNQAQKMRRLLGEMLSATSTDDPALSPTEVMELILEAGGEEGKVAVQLAPGLPSLRLSAAGLRRALAPLLARLRSCPGGVQVRVSPGDEGACRMTISAAGLQPWWVPGLTARLVTAMGGHIEASEHAGEAGQQAPAICLVFPAVLA